MISSEATGIENGQRVPATWPECWVSRETLSQYQLRGIEIQRAALRLLLGIEARTMEELSVDLNCTRAAVSAAFQTLSEKLGFSRCLKTETARLHFSEAGRKRWAEKRQSSANPTAKTENEGHKKNEPRR